MKQSRWASPIFWSGVAAQLIVIAGVIFSPEINEKIKVVVGAILEIYTVFCMANNPTNKNGF